VGRRLFPAVLVVMAAIADSRGAHHVAFDVLILAVPFTAVAALDAFGKFLDARDDAVIALQSFLWGIALALVVLSCGVRSNAVGPTPQLAISTTIACVAVFAIKAFFAVAPALRRLAALRPAKP
jgi:hypothetical protein